MVTVNYNLKLLYARHGIDLKMHAACLSGANIRQVFNNTKCFNKNFNQVA